MSRLAVYQSLWAMNSGVAHDTSSNLEDTFAMVANAGFDGMVLDLDNQSEDLINRARPLFRKYGLGCELNAFPTSMEDMQPMWALAQELAAERVNIVARVIPNSVDRGGGQGRGNCCFRNSPKLCNQRARLHCRTTECRARNATLRRFVALCCRSRDNPAGRRTAKRAHQSNFATYSCLPGPNSISTANSAADRFSSAPALGGAISGVVGTGIQAMAQKCR